MKNKNTREKVYDLIYGFLGNGVSVFNKAEIIENNDYRFIAHIETDRSVKFIDKNMPDEVKRGIKYMARTITGCGFSPSPEDISPEYATYMTIPDPQTTIEEMKAFGYTDDIMLPLSNKRAVELYDNKVRVYLLYPDDMEAIPKSREDILKHDGYCGVERKDWERSTVCTAEMIFALNKEHIKESVLFKTEFSAVGNPIGKFGIYKVRGDLNEAGEHIRNKTLEEIKNNGYDFEVNRVNYKLVYTGNLDINSTMINLQNLKNMFQTDNIDLPVDYNASGVTTSDIIVLNRRGKISAHYVGDKGFDEIPNFTEKDFDYRLFLREQLGGLFDLPNITEEDITMIYKTPQKAFGIKVRIENAGARKALIDAKAKEETNKKRGETEL